MISYDKQPHRISASDLVKVRYVFECLTLTATCFTLLRERFFEIFTHIPRRSVIKATWSNTKCTVGRDTLKKSHSHDCR